eukprot:jgi/Chrzof1/5079/Cz15g10290.t1
MDKPMHQAGLLHWDHCPIEDAAAMAAALTATAAASPDTAPAATDTSATAGSSSHTLLLIVAPAVLSHILVLLCVALYRKWKHRNKITDIAKGQGTCAVEQLAGSVPGLFGSHGWRKGVRQHSGSAPGSSTHSKGSTTNVSIRWAELQQ